MALTPPPDITEHELTRAQHLALAGFVRASNAVADFHKRKGGTP